MNKIIIGLVILVVLLIVIYFIFWGNSRKKGNTVAIKNNATTTKNNTIDNAVDILTRQCARWAVASQQDTNAIVAVLHANYGVGYLGAIQDTTSNDDFNRITGLDFQEFQKHIVGIQDDATKKLVSQCPQLASSFDEYLLGLIYRS